MKTFADMTSDERAQHKGMWVIYQTPLGEHLAIYEMGTTLFEPRYGRFGVSLLDLPRAWNPDGTPAKEKA